MIKTYSEEFSDVQCLIGDIVVVNRGWGYEQTKVLRIYIGADASEWKYFDHEGEIDERHIVHVY